MHKCYELVLLNPIYPIQEVHIILIFEEQHVHSSIIKLPQKYISLCVKDQEEPVPMIFYYWKQIKGPFRTSKGTFICISSNFRFITISHQDVLSMVDGTFEDMHSFKHHLKICSLISMSVNSIFYASLLVIMNCWSVLRCIQNVHPRLFQVHIYIFYFIVFSQIQYYFCRNQPLSIINLIAENFSKRISSIEKVDSICSLNPTNTGNIVRIIANCFSCSLLFIQKNSYSLTFFPKYQIPFNR